MNIILKSKSIFDSIGDEPFEGYVVVEENKIKNVEKGEIPDELVCDSKYRIIDCEERTILPGICDPHIHLYLGAINMATVNLYDCISEDEAAKKIAEFYKDRDDKWCLAFGWTHYKWEGEKLPTKHSLDKYISDRPVLAFNDEIHGAWVNSKALEICGIDKDTLDPLENTIFRDEHGIPSGYLLEQPAMRLAADIALVDDVDYEKKLIAQFIEGAHKRGVTSVGDVHVMDINKYEACKELEKEGNLNLRVFFSPPIETTLEKAIALKKEYNSNKLSFLGLKGFVDGVPLGHTGYMVEEYTDKPGYRGEPFLDLEWLNEKTVELYKNDIPVRLHACGDAAVRASLDAIEKAQNISGKKDVRNTIEHIECIHKDDIDRFGNLDVIASIQPAHLVMEDMETHPIYGILGETRAEYSWLGKTLLNNGAKMAFGTDYPIVELEPMETVYRATTRTMANDLPREGYNPKEKFNVSEALKGITSWASYLMKAEKYIGTLEVGKIADIAVLDKNIFVTDVFDIIDIKFDLTIFDGEIVHNNFSK